MDFDLPESVAALQRTVREFCEAEVKPHAREWDRRGEFPHATVRKLGELGLLGLTIPEEFGGSGLDALSVATVIECVASYDGSLALTVASHNGLCAAHLKSFGSEAQKKRYLPALATGERLGAWALTEPSSGSDAASLRTVAVRRGDDWVLNGSKTFITQGSVGDVFVVLASTDATKRQRGISAFVLEKGARGFGQRPLHGKLGMRSSDTAELTFEEVVVSDDARVGQVNHGFIDTLSILDRGRIGIAALALGLGTGALREAARYAKDRSAFGSPIAQFQAIQWMLANSATALSAARLLIWRATQRCDAGLPFGREASMAKLWAAQAAMRTCERAVQIHGGYGYTDEFPVERYLRDAKLCEIGEGTNEVQRLVISREDLEGMRARARSTTPRGTLATRILAGDVRAASRLMRDVEDWRPSAIPELQALFPHTGRARVVGLTGSPGAGKSSLGDRLIHAFRQRGKSVGVIAVDPSSPFTGGAILGDRVRMQGHAEDPKVFIRSLATRGHLGGLSRATADCVRVMDAMGKDVILVETVGVGQDEVDIAGLAHTVVLLVVPGMGDDVQAIKAGILEIADVFCINKSDRDGADRTERDLRGMLELRHAVSFGRPKVDFLWEPPIVRTVALDGRGVDSLSKAIDDHGTFLDQSGQAAEREVLRARTEFLAILRERLVASALERLERRRGQLDEIAHRIARREADPWSLALELAR